MSPYDLVAYSSDKSDEFLLDINCEEQSGLAPMSAVDTTHGLQAAQSNNSNVSVQTGNKHTVSHQSLLPQVRLLKHPRLLIPIRKAIEYHRQQRIAGFESALMDIQKKINSKKLRPHPL